MAKATKIVFIQKLSDTGFYFEGTKQKEKLFQLRKNKWCK